MLLAPPHPTILRTAALPAVEALTGGEPPHVPLSPRALQALASSFLNPDRVLSAYDAALTSQGVGDPIPQAPHSLSEKPSQQQTLPQNQHVLAPLGLSRLTCPAVVTEDEPAAPPSLSLPPPSQWPIHPSAFVCRLATIILQRSKLFAPSFRNEAPGRREISEALHTAQFSVGEVVARSEFFVDALLDDLLNDCVTELNRLDSDRRIADEYAAFLRNTISLREEINKLNQLEVTLRSCWIDTSGEKKF